jgi:ATP diphosphatase
MDSIQKLLEVMSALRDPRSGCPWDLQQDFSTIAPYTVEEAYEVADAIARDDLAGLRDELGDLLFQVVFHAQLAAELEAFDFEDVARGICEKMLRRHPHVFGNDSQRARGAVKGDWERIKAEERVSDSAASSVLDGIALSLPALKRAQKLGKRAASRGFDWPDAAGPREKIDEELAELTQARAAADRAGTAEELGDLLFAAVNLARHLDIDAEEALAAANRKFERRFRDMESRIVAAGGDLEAMELDELEAEWKRSKEQLSSGGR